MYIIHDKTFNLCNYKYMNIHMYISLKDVEESDSTPSGDRSRVFY